MPSLASISVESDERPDEGRLLSSWSLSLLLFSAYALSAWLSLPLALEGTFASPVWPPSGIALAALMIRPKLWPAVFGGAVAANLIALGGHPALSPGSAALSCLLIGLGNTAEGLVGATLIRMRTTQTGQEFSASATGAAHFVLVALFTCAIAATVGALVMLGLGVAPRSIAGTVWVTWWTGDVVGILVCTPLLLAWCPLSTTTANEPVDGSWAEGALLLACSLGLGLAAFGPWTTAQAGAGLIYLTIPVLGWAAVRFGRRGGTIAVLLLAAIAVGSSLAGPNAFSFHASGQNTTLLLLQGFVAMCAFTTLLLTGALSQRSRALAELAVEVGQRSEAERALQALNASLEQQVAAQVESLRASEARLYQTQKLETLGLLAGGIAHDTNNVLQAMFLHCDELESRLRDGQPTSPSLAALRTSSRTLADLARQLLETSGRGPLRSERVDLAALVREMASLLEVSVPKKARLSLQLEAEQHLVVGDPSQLRQVILNLVTNAAEAVGDTSGAITISTSVEEGAALEGPDGEPLPVGDFLRVEVSDTGSGMSGETQARVFDPFFTTKATGRGLGLAAVLGIVRGHGGALQLRSAVGEGTTVSIHLPLAPPAPEAPPVEVPSGAAEAGRRPTILLADDNAMIRTVTTTLLKASGYEVVVAVDGREAVEAYQAGSAEIDLVLLDLTMPELNGAEALRAMRAIDPEVRAVIMSGYSSEKLAAHFPNEPPPPLLIKPFKLDALIAALKQVAG